MDKAPKQHPTPKAKKPAQKPKSRDLSRASGHHLTKHDSATMEVHHHPQLDHKPKPWKEYLLEYIMIVLAVTTGFFAESIREYLGDHGKETEYVASLKNDLKQDTANIALQIKNIKVQVMWMDSLIILVNKPSLTSDEVNAAYYYGRWATRKPDFEITDRTVIQLKSSGNFRLIKDEHLIDGILEYQKQFDSYKAQSAGDITERGQLYPFISRIFDGNVFQTMVDNTTNAISRPTGLHTLNPVGKKFISQYVYYQHQLKSSFIYEVTRLEIMKATAEGMLKTIENDYKE